MEAQLFPIYSACSSCGCPCDSTCGSECQGRTLSSQCGMWDLCHASYGRGESPFQRASATMGSGEHSAGTSRSMAHCVRGTQDADFAYLGRSCTHGWRGGCWCVPTWATLKTWAWCTRQRKQAVHDLPQRIPKPSAKLGQKVRQRG